MYNSNSIKNLISSDVSRLCLDEHDTSQAPGPSSDFQPKPTILCWSRHTLCNSYICVRYLSTIKGSSSGRHFSSSCWSPARLIRGSGSVLGSGRVFPRHNWKQPGPPPICQYLAAALEGRRNKRTRHNQDTGERVWPCFAELGLDHHLFRPVLRSPLANFYICIAHLTPEELGEGGLGRQTMRGENQWNKLWTVLPYKLRVMYIVQL